MDELLFPLTLNFVTFLQDYKLKGHYDEEQNNPVFVSVLDMLMCYLLSIPSIPTVKIHI